MIRPLSYEASREPSGHQGLGVVSCGFGAAGALLLAYSLWRLVGDGSPIYFGVCLLAFVPTALGAVLALVAFLTSRRRWALLGLVVNAFLLAGLLVLLLLGPGPE
jgi:hypothetical protein